MPSDNTYKIPDDMKQIIARILALQSLATDPGQKIAMAGTVMQWIKIGLVMKYGDWSLVPANYQQIFAEDRETWQHAMITYTKGIEFWGHALLPCQDITEDMAIIASMENMLDYRQLDYNFTTHMFGQNALELEDAAEQERMELDNMKRHKREVPVS
jgi:hypothetical protein